MVAILDEVKTIIREINEARQQVPGAFRPAVTSIVQPILNRLYVLQSHLEKENGNST